MERRKLLIGTGALAAGGAAGLGTGAFTSVQADRDMTVTVADDTNALLEIKKSNSPNAEEYVTTDDGVVGIDISENGVNRDATTIIRDLFHVKNNGSQPVYVWIENEPDGLGFFADDTSGVKSAEDSDTGVGVGDQPDNAPLGHPRPQNLYLQPGEQLREFGFWITDPDALEDDETDSITIWAATEDEIIGSELGGYDFENDPAGIL